MCSWMSPRQIRVDGLQARYFEHGEGKTVLLLHGASLGSSADVWQRNLAPLAAYGLRVIAPDLPGFGRSDNPDDPSVSYRKKFVVAFMDALGLPRASFVGHSQSGRIAVDLAFSAPDRVAKVVVLGTGSLLPPLGEKKGGEGDEGGDIEPTVGETQALLEANLFDKRLATDEEVKLRHAMSIGKNFAAFLARKSAKEKTEPLWQRLSSCPVPLLMLYGENDRGEAAKRVARAKEAHPALDLRLLPRCAHLVQWDAAAAFADIAGRFLAG